MGGPASDGLTVALVEGPDARPGLRERWRRLAEARSNPFVTPEWFDAWHGVKAAGAEARIAVVEHGEELVGVMPMAIEPGRLGRRLRFVGARFGDCFHPACPPEEEVAVAQAAGGALRDCEWSVIELRNALVSHGWSDAFRAAAGASGAVGATAIQVLPYVDFGGLDWSGFLGSRSRNFRKGLWRSMRRLSDRGEVSFRISDERTLPADLRRFFELHEMRWGRRSAFLNPRSMEFHGQLAVAVLERGWLRLGNLELNGCTIAATYGWRVGDRFSEFQRGYDTTLIAVAPGKLVMGEMMRTLNQEGARIYDQLLGDEEYKMRLADGVREVTSVRAARPWRPAGGAIRMEPLLRRGYSRLPEDFRALVRARRAAGG